MLRIILTLLLLYFTAASQENKKEKLLSLNYAKLSVSVDPETGGRVVSLRYDDKEFLTGRNIHPDNYGSTLWPSPQSLWNWPPPAILDAEQYKIKKSGSIISLVSKRDQKLGLQFSKSFVIDSTDTSLIIAYKIHNISEKNVELAPWEITRMPKGGIVLFPKGSAEPEPKTFDPIPYAEQDGVLWYKNDKDEKLKNHLLSVADGAEGWLAYILDGYVYIKIFKDVAPDQQFENEGEIPIYVSPSNAYVEIEAQGSKNNLKPGSNLEWKMKWIIRKLPEQINNEYQNNQVISFIRSLISK